MPRREGGGAEVICHTLSHKLAEYNVEVATAYGSSAQAREFLQIPRYSQTLLRKTFFDYMNPLASARLSEILQEWAPDIVHFHNVYGLSSKIIQDADQLGFPTVVTIHDKWPICYRPLASSDGCAMSCKLLLYPLCFLHNEIRKQHLGGSTLVVASNHLRRQLINSGYRQVERIPNGVDIPESRAQMSRRAFFVGRLNKSKGIDLLPEIADILESHDVLVEVAGDGSDRAVVESRKNISFRGYLDRPQLHDFYRKGGILLFLSRIDENFPMSIAEAMSYGIPVVAVRCGGVPELVSDGETGFLTSLHSQEIAEKALHIIDNEKLWNSMSENAREHAKRMSWAAVVNQYKNLYTSLVDSK